MNAILPALLVLIPVALLVYLLTRKKADAGSGSPATGHGDDMIINEDRKRLYRAMKRYFLEEKIAEDDWRAFEYLDGLARESLKDRALLTKKMASWLKVSPEEAAETLERVLEAIQTVKQRSKND